MFHCFNMFLLFTGGKQKVAQTASQAEFISWGAPDIIWRQVSLGWGGCEEATSPAHTKCASTHLNGAHSYIHWWRRLKRCSPFFFLLLLFPAGIIYSAQDHVCCAPLSRGAFADARLLVTSHRGAHRLPALPLFQRVLFRPGINPLEYSTGNDATPLSGPQPPPLPPPSHW